MKLILKKLKIIIISRLYVHNCALSTFTNDDFNNLIVNLKNDKKIIRITTNDKPNDYKYMLIKDCIPLRDAEGDLPYYALSGADLVYQYNYGTFLSIPREIS